MQIQSAADVVTRIAQDPAFAEEVKANPGKAIARVAVPMPLQSDNWVYRIVVGSLGIVIITTVFGGIYLASLSKGLPEGIIALSSAAVGALAGLLAPSPARK